MKKPYSFLIFSLFLHSLMLFSRFENTAPLLPEEKRYTIVKLKIENEIPYKSIDNQTKTNRVEKIKPPIPKKNRSKNFKLNDLGLLAHESLDYIKPKLSEIFDEDNKEISFEKSLNKDEDKFYSYFQRIKIKLDNVWQLRVRDVVVGLIEENKLSFGENKVTYLLITLDRNGSLVKVQHISSSGLVDLDQTAVNAFRLAEPFPNPPKDLIESDGFVRVKWKFIVIL